MSIALIRAAIEKHLAATPQSIETAYENVAYTPKPDVPFQRVFLLPGQTTNPTLDGTTDIEVGVFQITLMYPQQKGVAAAQARAEVLRQRFKARTELVEGDVKVRIDSTPSVGPSQVIGDRYALPVSINYDARIKKTS